MKRTSILVAGLVVAATLVLTGCPENGEIPNNDVIGNDTLVTMAGGVFQPSTLTIEAGEAVTWLNDDNVIHTVTSEDFGSGNIAPGSEFTQDFGEPGEYEYWCAIHPEMVGTIVVE